MDFFQHQDTARRNTQWLVVFFLLAVLSLIALTTAAVAITLYFFQFNSDTAVRAMDGNTNMLVAAWQLITWEMLAGITTVVVIVVAIGSLYKFSQLSGGGRRVAEALGGRLLTSDSQDYDERKILNVVEEMAIASGTPVPPVYLMEDDSINAFAAGFKPQDAVIGVTRGCIRLLDRDELQGVIAHEFSHILHGDMRLNIRLTGVLHGILAIGLIGYFVFRSTAYSTIGSRRRGNIAGIVMLGLALIVVGYVGTFFGNIIKSAVSRQREFLADASSVQFTRNPTGISGALKKIGGYPAGSKLKAPAAAEFSHMYFGQGVVTRFNKLMATHPPLQDRILRIEPRWRGEFPAVSLAGASSTSASSAAAAQPTTEGVSQLQSGAATSQPPPSAIDSIGQPSAEHVNYAHQLITELKDALKDAARNPFSARAIVYCLLLDEKNALANQQQWQQLQQNADPQVLAFTKKLYQDVQQLQDEAILPLLDLCLPSLKKLSDSQYRHFIGNVVALVKADKKVSLFEWSLYRILIHNLEPHRYDGKSHSLKRCVDECRVLLSMVAHAGHNSDSQSRAAFEAGFKELGLGSRFFVEASLIGLGDLDKALDKLKNLKPLQKPQLLKALVTCISHDQTVTTTEKELFRAIADSLDCPVPPLLEGQQL